MSYSVIRISKLYSIVICQYFHYVVIKFVLFNSVCISTESKLKTENIVSEILISKLKIS